jgi:hypothetical protein
MKIKQIFEKPIDRNVDPVISVELKDEDKYLDEVAEYVFTESSINSMTGLLRNVSGNMENTGVWINGYFGSGKSHFIKYLFHLLGNHKEIKDLAWDNFEDWTRKQTKDIPDVTPADVADLKRKFTGRNVESIIFNIDAVADHRKGESIITRVLFNQFNHFRGFNKFNIEAAMLLEKKIDAQGKLAEFHSALLEDHEEPWPEKALDYLGSNLDGLLETAKRFLPNLDVVSAKKTISEANHYSRIDAFIPEITEYIATKAEDFRLIFMVDEVSQYINTDLNKLLNLQTIVEGIGNDCKSKVWVVCTAQLDLRELIGNEQLASQSYSRIQARFQTKISLQSQQADYIAKKRLLDKNEEGKSSLISFYSKHKHDIEGQFSLPADVKGPYKNYASELDFLESYPLLPYQFKLVSDVLESLHSKGQLDAIKETARSLIGATHIAVKNCVDNEIGYFVPFDTFFSSQLSQHLQNSARNLIDRAQNCFAEQEEQEKRFAKRVIQNLFMASHLVNGKAEHFPATKENLILMMLTSLEESRPELSQKVEEVLEMLEKNAMVEKDTKQRYKFLTNDQREVALEIDNTRVGTTEKDEFLKQILKDLGLPLDTSYQRNGMNVGVQLWYGSISDGKDSNPLKVRFDATDEAKGEDPAFIVLQNPRNRLRILLGAALVGELNFEREWDIYLKSLAFFKANQNPSTDNRRSAIEHFKGLNETRRTSLKKNIGNAIMNASVLIGTRCLAMNSLQGSDVVARFKSATDELALEVFPKFSLSNGLAIKNADLGAALAKIEKGSWVPGTPLPEPAKELEAKIRINTKTGDFALSRLVKLFMEPPYGWPEAAIIEALAHVIKADQWQAEFHGNILERPSDLQGPGLRSADREYIKLREKKSVDSEGFKAFAETANAVLAFGLVKQTDTPKEALETVKNFLETWINSSKDLKQALRATRLGPHAEQFANLAEPLFHQREEAKFMESFIAQASDLKKALDNLKTLQEFWNSQKDQVHRLLEYTKAQQAELFYLPEDDQKAFLELSNIVNSDQLHHELVAANKLHVRVKMGFTAALEAAKIKLKEEYQAVFKTLKAEAEKLKAPFDLVPDPEEYIQNLLLDITLQKANVSLAGAELFQSSVLEKIMAATKPPGEPEKSPGKYAIGKRLKASVPAVIHSEKEIDTLVAQLKSDLLKELQESGSVILQF